MCVTSETTDNRKILGTSTWTRRNVIIGVSPRENRDAAFVDRNEQRRFVTYPLEDSFRRPARDTRARKGCDSIRDHLWEGWFPAGKRSPTAARCGNIPGDIYHLRELEGGKDRRWTPFRQRRATMNRVNLEPFLPRLLSNGFQIAMETAKRFSKFNQLLLTLTK